MKMRKVWCIALAAAMTFMSTLSAADAVTGAMERAIDKAAPVAKTCFIFISITSL